jgi:N-acetylglucosaminyl-diphospho-decaprenol L-rhamnosyltransferase
LNPDATIETGLEAMRECCARPDAAGAGGKLVDEAGLPQAGFMFRRFPTPRALIFETLGLNRIWPHNPVNWQFRCLDTDTDVEQPVDQPAGAFLMIRRDIWEKLDGFDERFHPLWFEDVDFALRAARLGKRMYYTPRAVAKHTGGHSILHMPLEIRAHNWYLSLLRYCTRHFGPWSLRCVCLAVIVGSFVRMGIGVVSQRSLKPIVVYGRVAGFASRVFLFQQVG